MGTLRDLRKYYLGRFLGTVFTENFGYDMKFVCPQGLVVLTFDGRFHLKGNPLKYVVKEHVPFISRGFFIKEDIPLAKISRGFKSAAYAPKLVKGSPHNNLY